MATRYTKQAEKQLGGAFDKQIQGIKSQVPAIQNLYDSLTQALDTSTQRQISSGSQNVMEDAARRGVLRSTMTTEGISDLQTRLSEALVQGKAQLGYQQAQDLSSIQQQVGQLGIDRAQAITSRADALRNSDLEDRRFRYQQEQDRIANQMERQRLAIQRQNANAANESVTPDVAAVNYLSAVTQETEGQYVGPNDFRTARQLFMEAGGTNKQFMDKYWRFTDPEKDWRQYYYGPNNIPKSGGGGGGSSRSGGRSAGRGGGGGGF